MNSIIEYNPQIRRAIELFLLYVSRKEETNSMSLADYNEEMCTEALIEMLPPGNPITDVKQLFLSEEKRAELQLYNSIAEIILHNYHSKYKSQFTKLSTLLEDILDKNPSDMNINGEDYIYRSNLSHYKRTITNKDYTHASSIVKISDTEVLTPHPDLSFGDKVKRSNTKEEGIVVSEECFFADRVWWCYVVFPSRGTNGIKIKTEYLVKC